MAYMNMLPLLLPALALCAPQHNRRHYSTGQVYFQNSCDYPVSVKPFPALGCEAGEGSQVAAGAFWTDTLTPCSNGNTVLKVYESSESAPMQFEYGVDSQNVWYDISFIDCISSEYDLSQCAGSGWRMGSELQCQEYKCSSGQGKDCCWQGYCDAQATGVDPEPCTGCGLDQGYTDSRAMGIVIELCPS